MALRFADRLDAARALARALDADLDVALVHKVGHPWNPESGEFVRTGDAELPDEVVVLSVPPDFRAVGSYYDRFEPVTDDEVLAALTVAGEEPLVDPGGP